MSLDLVSVQRGVNPFEKYEKVKIVAADDLTAVCIVRIRDPPPGMKETDNQFAMKFLNQHGDTDGDASLAAAQELQNEVEKYCKLQDHPNIVRVFDIFEYSSNFYIVMEFCRGGNLIGRSFRERGELHKFYAEPYPEHEAAKVVGKLLHAVRYLHDRHIVHGELRAENIVYQNDEPESDIKVVDLGMSRLDSDKSRGERQNYVKNYAAAPENYKGEYTTASDMWAIGVITFVILSGNFPFARDTSGSAQQHAEEAKYNFEAEVWEGVSEDAMSFIDSLLVVDPSERLSAGKAQLHKWMKKEFPLEEQKPSKMVMDQVKLELQLATEMTRFHKIVLNTLAHLMSHNDLRDLRKAFDAMDTNNSGIISFKEFKSAMSQAGMSEDELAKIFDGVGIEEDGSKMSYLEFLGATLEFHTKINEAVLVEAFHCLDKDRNGYLAPDDIMNVYPTNKEDAKRIMTEIGAEDGKVSCETFLAAFRKESDKLRTEALDPIVLPKPSSL